MANQNEKRRLKIPQLIRELLAEFISTFILLCFGIGSVAQKVLSRGENGSTLSINLSWGMGVTFGIYWAGGISDALCEFDGGTRYVTGINATAGIWATYPQPYLSHIGGFFDQVFGTALLVGCIFAVIDRNNNAVDKGMAPLIIGFIVFVIGMTFGLNCGYAINPARDLSPRIFTAIAGWGSEVFSAYDYWFYIPLIGEVIGGPLGAFTYILFIEMHHMNEEDELFVDDVEIHSRERCTQSREGQTEPNEEDNQVTKGESRLPEEINSINPQLSHEEMNHAHTKLLDESVHGKQFRGKDVEEVGKNSLPQHKRETRPTYRRQSSFVEILNKLSFTPKNYDTLDSPPDITTEF